VGTGWINDSAVPGNLIDEIVAGFSNVVVDLKVGRSPTSVNTVSLH
jgi:hypothetical protein